MPLRGARTPPQGHLRIGPVSYRLWMNGGLNPSGPRQARPTHRPSTSPSDCPCDGCLLPGTRVSLRCCTGRPGEEPSQRIGLSHSRLTCPIRNRPVPFAVGLSHPESACPIRSWPVPPGILSHPESTCPIAVPSPSSEPLQLIRPRCPLALLSHAGVPLVRRTPAWRRQRPPKRNTAAPWRTPRWLNVSSVGAIRPRGRSGLSLPRSPRLPIQLRRPPTAPVAAAGHARGCPARASGDR